MVWPWRLMGNGAEIKGEQESRHHGHKPAGAGKLSKAVAELLLPHPIAAEMLEVLIGSPYRGRGESGRMKSILPRESLPGRWRCRSEGIR